MHTEKIMVKSTCCCFQYRYSSHGWGETGENSVLNPYWGLGQNTEKLVCVFGREGGGGMFSLAKSHLKIKVCQDPSIPVGGTSV